MTVAFSRRVVIHTNVGAVNIGPIDYMACHRLTSNWRSSSKHSAQISSDSHGYFSSTNFYRSITLGKPTMLLVLAKPSAVLTANFHGTSQLARKSVDVLVKYWKIDTHTAGQLVALL